MTGRAMNPEIQKPPDLADFARLAEQYIPGRRAIFTIVEASLLELIPEEAARILVIGAGGGEEILRLGQDNPNWSFVGVDTNPAMVDLARQRLDGSPVGPRSRIETTTIEALEDSGFDAATCILTAHFVPDDGAKLAFFEAIRSRLKPGAPLAIIDGIGVTGEVGTELLRRIWARHAMRNGVSKEAAVANAQNFKNVAVVSEAREEELLAGAGFEKLTPIFQGLSIKGWLAFA